MKIVYSLVWGPPFEKNSKNVEFRDTFGSEEEDKIGENEHFATAAAW